LDWRLRFSEYQNAVPGIVTDNLPNSAFVGELVFDEDTLGSSAVLGNFRKSMQGQLIVDE
jgi:hypothetical protein